MELKEWVPWCLSALSLTYPWLLGNKQRIGWLVNATSAFFGTLYNVATEQYGFVPASSFCVLMCVRNFIRWGREADTKVPVEMDAKLKETEKCS